MRRAICWIILLIGIAAAQAGCQSPQPAGRIQAGPIPVLNSDWAKASGFTPRQASEALKLYTAKCIRCHKSYDPTPYSDTQWRVWMSKMGRKAKLSPGQEEQLSRYLQAFRAAAKSEQKKSN